MYTNVKYLLHYDINDNEGRNYALSASTKAGYIMNTLGKLNYNVNVISACLTSKKSNVGFSNTNIGDKILLTKLPALKWGSNKICRILPFIWSKVGLFVYLLFHLKKNDVVIVYHSLELLKTVEVLKKLIGFKLILEVEEIYGDVTGNKKTIQVERTYFKLADAYFFSTKMLNDVVNTDSKPSVINLGTYQVEEEQKCRIFKNNLQNEKEDTIHCVYAGTFDPRKGGAIAAAAAAEYLPFGYHIHILGFGSDKETKDMQELIDKLAKKTKAQISYDGCLTGRDYITFLQNCQIGLSTQNPDADFNNTSFPSKILSYMSNGLKVVSIRIPAIENSDVGQYMFFYDSQNPKDIAQAIIKAGTSDFFDSRAVIKELDVKFSLDVKNVIDRLLLDCV